MKNKKLKKKIKTGSKKEREKIAKQREIVIGQSDEAYVSGLKKFVSETFTIYMKTYALHWNYEGNKFYGVHNLTESHYKELADSIDELAERVRALGHKAPVSLEQILDFGSFKEYTDFSNNEVALRELSNNHRVIAKEAVYLAEICEKIGDKYTHDLLVNRSGAHEKYAWMLESLQ